MSPAPSPAPTPAPSPEPSHEPPARIGWRPLLAHALHVPLVLLPTLVLRGLAGLDATTLCFTIGITTAAVLESLFVRRSFEAPSARVHDRTAVRAAQAVGIGLLALFWCAQVERIVLRADWLGFQLAGAALLSIGIALRSLAIRALGTQFVSDIQTDGRVVRSGVYAWLRHPSEIGLLLIASGGPLLLGAPLSAATATVLLLPISIWRTRREDKALSAAANVARSDPGKV